MFPKTSVLPTKGEIAGKEMSKSLRGLLGLGLKLRLVYFKAQTCDAMYATLLFSGKNMGLGFRLPCVGNGLLSLTGFSNNSTLS